MSTPFSDSVLLPLPLGDSNFTKMRENGKIYVDKTRMLYELAKSDQLVFLARPRRFGKSLLVSTFYSLFRYGLRDFRGLEIEKLWNDSGRYYVIHLDFSEEKNFLDGADFAKKFNAYLLRYLKFNQLSQVDSLSSDGINEFASWLDTQPNTSVVLLIDEYDSPLTACLNDSETFQEVRTVLASFYSKLKVRTRVFRFLFMTGITKFSNASIFSELNNLKDITLEPKYGEIVGYTSGELERYFGDYIGQASKMLRVTYQKLFEELTANYNGFCFEETASEKVFSPWSILNFFDSPKRGFRNYWFESGGQPSLLLQYVKEHALMEPAEYAQKRSITIPELSATVPTEEINETVLLVQTGYLTIKESRNDVLYLGYPNREVENSMASLYLSRFLRGKTLAQIKGMDLPLILAQGEVEEFVNRLNIAFLALDYDRYFITDEKKCEGSLLLILHGSGLQAGIETHNALGRSDIEFTVAQTHWVIELKFARTKKEVPKLLDEALKQIKGRHYGMQSLEKRLIRLALVFSEQKRHFVAYAVADPAPK